MSLLETQLLCRGIQNTSRQRPTIITATERRGYTQIKFLDTPSFHRKLPYGKSRTYGMSLIEVVLAIAVAGFVLTSAVSLLVSISSIWSERSERHFFTDHVDGVTEFLNATFAASGTTISNIPNESQEQIDDDEQPDEDNEPTQESGSLISSTSDPIRWERPPGFANYREPLLNFSMSDDSPILVGPENTPTLGINAFLHFDPDEGLSLLWHSMIQEDVENLNDLNRTLISPLVTKITYIYWDERFEAWEEEEQPMEGDGQDQYILPRFVKLLFEYEGVTKERILTIPVPTRSALIF